MKPLSLLTLFSLALFAACGNSDASLAANSSSSNSAGYHASAQIQTEGALAETRTAGSRQPEDARSAGVLKQNISLAQSTAAAIDTAPSDRKVVRNAELNLEADDPDDAQRKITSIAELRGGFVVESQQSSSEIRSTIPDIVTMTVRVPADKFGDALADIRNVSTRVIVETVKGQDVTEEFIDIEAQLKAKKALEQQFMEIMKRANTVGDALHVQSQLADLRGEIERIEGRKRFLENQSAMSTIKVRLQTAKVIAASSVGIGGRLADSFAAGADVAISFVLGLVTVVIAALPFAIFIGLPVFVLFRYVLKRQSRARSVIDFAEDELKRA